MACQGTSSFNGNSPQCRVGYSPCSGSILGAAISKLSYMVPFVYFLSFFFLLHNS